ncbi:hypothetical protein A2U01_0064476, partial [Trifolium medium]|nr:hypothetical protein [Trifolium medium]
AELELELELELGYMTYIA